MPAPAQSSFAPFQYSTTSRNGWNRRSGATCHRRNSSFSTQPRVETAGTEKTHRQAVERTTTFSTQPRVETAGTGTASEGGDLGYDLSVLNHESKRLEPSTITASSMILEPTFSTQPRVETAGTPNCFSAVGWSCFLSVLNHESKRLELVENIGANNHPVTFSTQPRVETAGTYASAVNP